MHAIADHSKLISSIFTLDFPLIRRSFYAHPASQPITLYNTTSLPPDNLAPRLAVRGQVVRLVRTSILTKS